MGESGEVHQRRCQFRRCTCSWPSTVASASRSIVGHQAASDPSAVVPLSSSWVKARPSIAMIADHATRGDDAGPVSSKLLNAIALLLTAFGR